MEINYTERWDEAYERGNTSDNLVKQLEFRACNDALAAVEPGRCLDIGTATGRYIRAFIDLGFDAYGIDHSAVAVNVTAKLLATAGIDASRVMVADARDIPFDDEFFALVTCMMGTIAHSNEPSRVFAEVRRVLCNNGYFIFSIWRPEVSECGFLSVNTPEVNRVLTQICTEIHPIESQIEAAGFTVISTQECVLADRQTYLQLSADCDVWSTLEAHLRARHRGLCGELGLYLCRKTG